jgi:hypothetical protein
MGIVFEIELKPVWFLKNTLVMGERIKAGLSMVTAHTTITHTTEW